MYEGTADANTLWQGDVVVGCAFPVFFNLSFSAQDWGSQFKLRIGPLAIVSHSCDLEIVSGKLKRSTVQFSPLVPVPSVLTKKPEALSRLRKHEAIDSAHPEFINYFFYQAFPDVLPDDMVIDLSVIHSFQSSVGLIQQLKEHKRLQLQSDAREYLQDRLALHFAREAE